MESLGDYEQLQKTVSAVQCEENHLMPNVAKCSVLSFTKNMSTITFNYR